MAKRGNNFPLSMRHNPRVCKCWLLSSAFFCILSYCQASLLLSSIVFFLLILFSGQLSLTFCILHFYISWPSPFFPIFWTAGQSPSETLIGCKHNIDRCSCVSDRPLSEYSNAFHSCGANLPQIFVPTVQNASHSKHHGDVR